MTTRAAHGEWVSLSAACRIMPKHVKRRLCRRPESEGEWRKTHFNPSVHSFPFVPSAFVTLPPAAEEAVPDEDENEENPFSTEFHEDQEAAYLKDPKKALQGFYDREGEKTLIHTSGSSVSVLFQFSTSAVLGEELEFEYEDKSHGSWLCRIK